MGKRIKVLYTIPNFKTAGSQYVLLSLFNGIDKTKFDPYVCVENYPELIPESIPLERRLIFKYTGNITSDISQFRKILKSRNIDLIHSWDYKSNYIEPLAGRLSKVKYLYTKKNNAWSKRWMLKSILSNHIIYNNPEMKKRFFNSLLFYNKTTFIPHGIDTSVFKFSSRRYQNTFNLGCIANINSNKNQLLLVKALKVLPKNVELHLYGNENKEYRITINNYIERHNLGNRVHFHGFIDNKYIPKVLSAFNLFILPSFNEGLPVSILEALACEVPVLSSDSGGGARFLLKQEYIFSTQNKEELISKILKIYSLKEDERRTIATKSLKYNIETHTLQTEIFAHEKLYEKLI
tara:strand:- start:3885 stop:4934 length:1050 start_codon:yes stop_codon:yes gene_type:complete